MLFSITSEQTIEASHARAGNSQYPIRESMQNSSLFILLCLKLLAYRRFRTINTIREEDKETFRRL